MLTFALMERTFSKPKNIFAFGFQIPGQPPADKKDSSYFPMDVGASGHYNSPEGKVTLKVSAREKMSDLKCAKIEMTVEGNVIGNQHIAVGSEGLVRVAYNGQKIEKPLLFLKLPPKAGESWNIDTKITGQTTDTIKGKFVAGEEEIEVPAGKYKTVTSTGDFEINGQPAKFAYWFAENVGIVKLTIDSGSTHLNLELQKYEPAK